MNWIPLTILAGATVTAVSCISPTGESASATSPSTGVKVLQSKSVTNMYLSNCSSCHGRAGEGGGAGTQTFLTKEKYKPKYDKPFFDAIKHGVKDAGMSEFGSSFSDQEIWALVVHIRELQTDALRREFGSPQPVEGVYHSDHHNFKMETVVDSGLKTPWAIDWLPSGEMLITNRPGTLLVGKNGKFAKVSGIPEVTELGQGGLMEVAVHPQYKENGWIYLSFTDPLNGDKRKGMTKLVRGKIKGVGSSPTWYGEQVIFQTKPDDYSSSSVHYGCRIVFDGKGHIYFGIGERGRGERAQDLTRPNGKIYRINEDGSVPKDNPFVGQKGVYEQIWSYGHRNPQGLVMNLNGELWETEHAPRGGDEVNKIIKAKNYGWPLVSFGINYNDTPLSVPWPKPEQNIVMPATRWIRAIGACGLDVARGPAFPNWKNDLLAGGLAGQNLDRIRVNSKGEVVEHEELIHGHGRVRDVSVGPDGFVYVALNGPDKIIRLVPAN